MAENKYFMDGVDLTEETFNAYMQKVMANDGYLVGEGSELEVIENTPAAMNVVVGTGKAWVRGVLYENTAAKTVTVDAADATYSRIDRIVVRLTWADDTVEAVYLKGTAAASPAAPALTQTSAVWELSLARILVTVGKTSIVTGDITDERNTTTCGQAACRLGDMHIEADGSLDAASHQIHNVADPTSAQDADTKGARDAAITAVNQPGRFLGMTVITASGNFTTKAATKKIRVTLYGAGGGGAAQTGSGANVAFWSEGGGAGAKAIKVFTVTGSTSYACVIGAAGVGATTANTNGGNGGNTTFTGPGSVVVTAGGGKGGAVTAARNGTYSAGGVATGGDINIPGMPAIEGTSGYPVLLRGKGGSTDVGHPGYQYNANEDGADAVGYGAGGNGGSGFNTVTRYGGDGAPGLIIIEEFS